MRLSEWEEGGFCLLTYSWTPVHQMRFFFSAHVVCDINKSLLLYLLDVKTPWCYLKYVKSISLNNPNAKPDFFAKNSKNSKRKITVEENLIVTSELLYLKISDTECLCLITCCLLSKGDLTDVAVVFRDSSCCPAAFSHSVWQNLWFFYITIRRSLQFGFQLPSNFNFLRCCVRIVTMVPPLSTTTTRHELRTPVVHK